MKLILDEWIVREVIDTLHMARTMLLGITGLDSPQEVKKKSANETAITRRINKAIDIIQQSGQPHICESLEEAAEKFANQDCVTFISRKKGFLAGAEWQKKKIPMPEDTVLFNKGVAEGRRLEREDMLKEAVEGEVEEWRSIVGYTNYEVSNTGKVLSRKQLKDGVLLKQSTNWAGYKYVTLHDDKYMAHTCFVHRLVAEAFVPNPENKKTVNHKNENKSDNRACNLEWATYIEQCSHGSMRGRITNLSLRTATDGEKKKFIRMRKYLRERGYIIDSDNLIAYWTNDTNRAVRMEKEPLFFQYRKYCGEVVPDYIVRSICRKEVERIDEHGNVKKYNSMTEAAKDNGVSISAIKRVLIGKNKSGKCNGYSFKYSKDLPKEDGE